MKKPTKVSRKVQVLNNDMIFPDSKTASTLGSRTTKRGKRKASR
jgi:hypothetical protein